MWDVVRSEEEEEEEEEEEGEQGQQDGSRKRQERGRGKTSIEKDVETQFGGKGYTESDTSTVGCSVDCDPNAIY